MELILELIDHLHHIFVKDGAWLTILQGIWVTVEISFFSLLFGTVLGAFVCFLRMGRIKFFRLLAGVYISVLRGAPVLMLLLLLFYGVFAKSDFGPVPVAILAFSLNTAAHVAELLRSAIKATDKGQVEAARTLGFSKFQAFRLVTFPQLVRIARPVYQSTAVNLIQWTSVVGYVTITDLTRVLNHTAARTMKPMTTFIVGMIIYVIMSYTVYGIVNLLDRHKTRGGLTKQ